MRKTESGGLKKRPWLRLGQTPDLNIAESLWRIPGVPIAREVNGEALNIAHKFYDSGDSVLLGVRGQF